MEAQAFKKFWKANFPEAYPIGNELRWVYGNRWFRIHSLPASKRYADTEAEYQIIFDRQNEIIEDLAEGGKVILLFGLYTEDWTNINYTEIPEFAEFSPVDRVALHEVRPAQYARKVNLDIYVKETEWKAHERNVILQAIADDRIRMMIILPEKKRIIAPYDGGVDVVMESEELRHEYAKKYEKWASVHPKGL